MARGQIRQNFPKSLRFMALFPLLKKTADIGRNRFVPFSLSLVGPPYQIRAYRAQLTGGSDLVFSFCIGGTRPTFSASADSKWGQRKGATSKNVNNRQKKLGQKSCRAKVPWIFRIFVPDFLQNFSRIFRALFLWKRRLLKIHQKSPPFFNAKSPSKYEKKAYMCVYIYIHNIFLERRQSNEKCQDEFRLSTNLAPVFRPL